MSSFGSSVSRRRKNTTKSTFGSRKLSTSRPSSHGKINSNNNKRVSGGRKKKSNNSVEKRNPPGFEKTTKLGEGGFGKVLKIDHGNGYRTLYAHLSNINIKVGTGVKRGDLIAESGNSGRASGPHLHYEVFKNKRQINPVNFFFNDLSPEEYDKVIEISSRPTQSL